MFPKRDKQIVEKNMQEAAILIGEGARKREAAEALKIPYSTFYRDWKRWCVKNHNELRSKFVVEMQEYLVRQHRLYGKAMQTNKLAVAAKVNAETIEKLQSFGIVPKVREKLEVTGQVTWGQFWDKIVKRKNDEQENKS